MSKTVITSIETIEDRPFYHWKGLINGKFYAKVEITKDEDGTPIIVSNFSTNSDFNGFVSAKMGFTHENLCSKAFAKITTQLIMGNGSGVEPYLDLVVDMEGEEVQNG
jgi:hypothetical protein